MKLALASALLLVVSLVGTTAQADSIRSFGVSGVDRYGEVAFGPGSVMNIDTVSGLISSADIYVRSGLDIDGVTRFLTDCFYIFRQGPNNDGISVILLPATPEHLPGVGLYLFLESISLVDYSGGTFSGAGFVGVPDVSGTLSPLQALQTGAAPPVDAPEAPAGLLSLVGIGALSAGILLRGRAPVLPYRLGDTFPEV